VTGPVTRVRKSLWRRLPTALRLRVRALVEWAVDLGRGEWYSQFGEDAVLQAYFETRAWKTGQSTPFLRRARYSKGFYVDVGAFSPKRFSNTYAFYRLGWRGITVEPTPGSLRGFKLSRPRDVSLEVAISNQPGMITFFCWDAPCVVNTVSEREAERIAWETGVEPRRITVPAVTLADLLTTHVPAGTSIDLLSIDVEGHELEVLMSNDWSRFRPDVVVVEQHADSLEQMVRGGAVQYLRERQYALHACVPPSVILVRRDEGAAIT